MDKKRVLVVDDEPDFALLVQGNLQKEGFDVDVAYNGVEGLEKIKQNPPDAVVLVATVRALKTHGGGPKMVAGRPLDKAYTEENIPLLSAGLANLEAHIHNVRRFGVPVVVAVNAFSTDSEAEIRLVEQAAIDAGAFAAVRSTHWEHGGEGAEELARAVEAAAASESEFQHLYPLHLSLKEKIEIIAREVYGAGDVEYSRNAERQLAWYEEAGYGYLPICMAKTHLSISHDVTMKGAPRGYTLPVREVRASVGAGFVYPLVGEMRTMPGLGATPAFMNVDIDEDGEVVGLF